LEEYREIIQAARDHVRKVPNPQSVIFEKVWHSGEVPTDWKRGNIMPIFKKGKRKSLGTTGLSVLALCLARSWSRSCCKLC